MKATMRKCPQCLEKKMFRQDQRTCGCPKPVKEKPTTPPKPVQVESDERRGDERSLTKITHERVKTLGDLVRVCQIDTEEWAVEQWSCTVWEMAAVPRAVGKSKDWSRPSTQPIVTQQFSVSAKLKRRGNILAAKDEIAALQKKAEKYSPKSYIRQVPATGSDNLLEITLADHHVGSLVWGKETGWDDYDSKIAIDCWEKALGALVSRTRSYRPDRALFVLGHDLLNADNRAGTTEHGTPQHADSRFQKMFVVARDAAIWAIDSLAQVVTNVDVAVVSGNHDALSCWQLGNSLECWFRNFKNIKIDNSPASRKYYQHGVNMFLLTHGDKGKFENYGKVMAAERPKMWGETLWREAQVGHKHHRQLLELEGASVRVLPSLRPPDAWTSENMYVGTLRAAEGFVWHRHEGLIGSATYSVLKK